MNNASLEMSNAAQEGSLGPPVLEMRGAQIRAVRDTSLVLLEDVNWTVMRGEFWVVAGPQRSGKTDLMMHAAGLLAPIQGECRILGCDAAEFDETHIAEREKMGVVFSDGRLFNQMTIAENVALPLRYHRFPGADELARAVETLLELTELAPFANSTPGTVAAGWRQRAALARALILKPEVLLLDNPNAGLIARHRRWLVNFLDQLWRGHEYFGGRGMTIVATTDDLRLWEHRQRKFAVLGDGTFSALGMWGDDEFGRHAAVKEWLAEAPEMERP